MHDFITFSAQGHMVTLVTFKLFTASSSVKRSKVMSRIKRKPVFGVSDTNGVVQQQKMAKGLKLWIYEVEGLYCLCSKNKGDDQRRGVLRLCFRICNQRTNGPLNAHLISWPSKAQNI